VIQFLKLELTNFAIYPKAAFSFSVDPAKPLTVIRGENESGKTTLMRAFLWVLFGAEGIQESSGIAYALRPVWAPKGEAVETKVLLSFRQSRGGKSVAFNLMRRLTTTDGATTRLDGDKVILSRQDPDGSFRPLSEAGIETLHGIIRPEMRDFYFIDADKAVDFVGGSEGNHSDQLMRRMIGKSIRALLAVDELRAAADRVESLRGGYIKEIAACNKGAAGTNHQQELQRVDAAIERIRADLPRAKEAFDAAAEVHRQSDEQFSSMIMKLERASKRSGELKKYRDDRDKLNIQRKQLIHQLGECVPGPGLAAALVSKSVKSVVERLEPMKEKGHIPPHELDVIPRLLQRGKCLCGTEIAEGTREADALVVLLEKARKTESGARFLDGVLNLATAHRRAGNAAVRDDRITTLRRELAELDPHVSELTRAIESLESEIAVEGGQQAAASEIRRDVNEKLAQRDTLRDTWQRMQSELERYETERRSLQETIRAAAGKSAQVRGLQAAARVAEIVRSVLKSAYEHIERDQVQDVSQSMTDLFSQMIGRTDDGLVSDVGLRALGSSASMPEYELYARYQNADKPLKLINGASRRALSVAFVLALAEQTGTRVPLVTDSLLHSTSGEVRRRLVEFLASGERVGQPIMFGTRADFQSAEVRSVLAANAGATFTLTAQSHVGKDVVRADPSRLQAKQVSVCNCGPADYCAVCERAGDASSSDLKRVPA
jgi:DNA sulfur modification protein DndD